jgi:hypothetical protein
MPRTDTSHGEVTASSPPVNPATGCPILLIAPYSDAPPAVTPATHSTVPAKGIVSPSFDRPANSRT